MTYAWTVGSGSVLNTTSAMFVSPSVNTTYTLTGTNAYGCLASDQVTVSVRSNNPDFNISTGMNAGYYTVSAIPVDLSAHSQAGFGYYWSVDELNSAATSLFLSIILRNGGRIPRPIPLPGLIIQATRMQTR